MNILTFWPFRSKHSTNSKINWFHVFHQDLVSPPEGLLINIIQIQRKIISTFLLHVIPQVSPVGGLHYNGELHPIPTPQDGLAVSIDDAIKYLLWTLTLLKKEKLVFPPGENPWRDARHLLRARAEPMGSWCGRLEHWSTSGQIQTPKVFFKKISTKMCLFSEFNPWQLKFVPQCQFCPLLNLSFPSGCKGPRCNFMMRTCTCASPWHLFRIAVSP